MYSRRVDACVREQKESKRGVGRGAGAGAGVKRSGALAGSRSSHVSNADRPGPRSPDADGVLSIGSQRTRRRVARLDIYLHTCPGCYRARRAHSDNAGLRLAFLGNRSCRLASTSHRIRLLPSALID